MGYRTTSRGFDWMFDADDGWALESVIGRFKRGTIVRAMGVKNPSRMERERVAMAERNWARLSVTLDQWRDERETRNREIEQLACMRIEAWSRLMSCCLMLGCVEDAMECAMEVRELGGAMERRARFAGDKVT